MTLCSLHFYVVEGERQCQLDAETQLILGFRILGLRV